MVLDMTVLRGLLIISASALLCAFAGGVTSYALGFFIPGYYRSVFRDGHEQWFEPLEVGIGLGVGQGLAAGVFVGSAVVFAVAWFNSRQNSSKPTITE